MRDQRDADETSGGNLGAVPVDAAWLARTREDALEADLPIIDAHHHLWDHRGRYLLDQILADIDCGHRVVATMHMEADAMYRAGGDPAFATVGETEFINGVAAMSASGLYGPARVCAGMVGFANLLLGDRVAAVLDEHLARGGARFKGIRHCSAFDSDPAVNTTPISVPRGLLLDPQFRAGFAHLGPRGLSFDGWLYHTQIGEFADLADAFPDTILVLDHVGAPIGIGAYAARGKEVFADWKQSVRALARRPNVRVKLGGMGMALFGFDLDKRAEPAGSFELARLWRPYVETCVDAFGAERCMFESNFPADKISSSYGVMWNAFKRTVAGASRSEKNALFFACANETYRLGLSA